MKFRDILLPFLLTFTLFFNSCNSEETITPDVPPEPDTEEPNEEEEASWQLVWEDDFDADELDQSKWSYQLGDGCHISQNLCGWGNNELQYYTEREQNISVEDGFLTITAHEEDYEGSDYTSARIRTIQKGDWRFGRIEVRAKLPQGQGIWPAIWMLPTDENFGGWPQSGEIDIMEMVGHEPETVHGTIHFGDPWPNNQNEGEPYSLESGIFADNYHVFSIEWEQNKIEFFVDGNLFFTVTPSTVSPKQYPFNDKFHLIMNIAVGGNWPGNPNSSTEFPQTMSIDYVRVYQFK
jgi:beta-glucanase (GH16 family)